MIKNWPLFRHRCNATTAFYFCFKFWVSEYSVIRRFGFWWLYSLRKRSLNLLFQMGGIEKHLLIVPGQELQGQVEIVDLCGLINRRSERCFESCPCSQACYCHPSDFRHANFPVKRRILQQPSSDFEAVSLNYTVSWVACQPLTKGGCRKGLLLMGWTCLSLAGHNWMK